VLLLLTGALLGPAVRGQEALRASLTGQMALEAKKRRIAAGWGDIRLGPVQVDLVGRMDVEASDNVWYRDESTDEDLIFRPGLTVRALYPVSEKNLLSFGAGLAYNKYLQNSELDYFHVAPDSDLAFDLYVGDFLINLHNRVYYTAEVANEASLSGVGRYGRFEDTVGALVVWDLNKLLLSFSADHQTYLATDEVYDYMDHTSELFGLRSAWLLTPVTPLGVELGLGTTDYSKDLLDDMLHYSAGVFYEMPAGRFTSLRLGAGYVRYEPTTHSNTNLTSDEALDGFYADLTFQHRITQTMTYQLSAGREVRAGVYSQTLELIYARAWVTWNILRGYGLTTSFGYEDGQESGSVYAWQLEEFSRFSTGLTISKRLNEKLYTSLGYSFSQRESNVRRRDYAQNRLVLSVNYNF